MLIISAVSAVATYAQANQAANRQNSALAQAAIVNNEAATEQYRQIDAQATDNMSARAREAMIEQARLRVVSGETGLAGVSADRLTQESKFNEGTDLASIASNRTNTLNQAYLEARGGAASMQSKANSINRPSLLGTGLQIAGAAASYGAETERLKRISTPNKVQATA